MNILLTSKQKELISILYNNNGLTQKELSALLGSSPASTSNIVQKILRYEPPLIAKEIIGKYRFYTLSDYGKKCYEDLLKEEVVVDAENEAKVLFAKTTYGKLKNLIASELLKKREEEIFGFLDSENLTR